MAVIASSILFGQVSILEENFDLPSLPATFSIIDNDGNTVANEVQEYTSAWIVKEDPMNTNNGTASSTSFFSPLDRADRWLITPQITLGGSANFISWKGLSHDPSFPDSYKIMISKTGNSVADFTDTLSIVINELPVWTNHTESLADFINETIYVAFVNTTFNGFKLYLDSLYVREQDPLSIEKDEINLSIYPNPISNVLNLSAGNSLIKKVDIYNSFGQKIVEEKLDNSATLHSINVSQLNTGIYFITVETSKGILRSKIVK